MSSRLSGIVRILLDQEVPRDTAQELRAGGVDAVHVGDLGMPAATDTGILDAARAREAVIVTLDAGFHTILAVSGANRPSVIRIRQQGLKTAAFVHLLGNLLSQCEADRHSGRIRAVLNGISRPARPP